MGASYNVLCQNITFVLSLCLCPPLLVHLPRSCLSRCLLPSLPPSPFSAFHLRSWSPSSATFPPNQYAPYAPAALFCVLLLTALLFGSSGADLDKFGEDGNHNCFHSRARDDYGAKLRAESSPREVYQRLLHRYTDTDIDIDTDTETHTETQTQRYQTLLHRYGKLCGLWQRQNLAPYGGVLKVLLKFSLFPPHFSGRSEGRRDLL